MEPKNEAAALTPERIEKLKAHLENNAFAQICGIKVADAVRLREDDRRGPP